MGLLTGEYLAEQIRPDRFGKKASPARLMIARNQGNTKIASQMMPASGLSDNVQPAERSTTISATAASPTTITISGPFSSTPAASAVQNTAAVVQALEALSRSRLCQR